MIQLRNPSYISDLSPCGIFLLTLLKNKQYLQTSMLAPNCSWLCHFSVSAGCAQKVYLSAFRAWNLRLETEILSKETEARELWISPIMRFAELNERPSYNGLNKTTIVILLLQCNLVMKRETSSRIVIEIMYNVLSKI